MPEARLVLPDGTFEVLPLDATDEVQRFGQRVTQISRPGVDGADFHQQGTRTMPWTVMIFRDGKTASELRQFQTYLMTAQGELIDYFDHNNYEWEDVVLVSVRGSRIEALVGATGFQEDPEDSLFGFWATLTLQLTTEPEAE